MAEQSAFDRNKIAEKAYTETSDLLDQLNLPPAFAAFLRKNKQIIWTIVIVVAVVVTTTSLYGSYRTYRVNKGASALDAAMGSGEQRLQQLEAVVDAYASTPSGVWARIELAHAARENGDTARAIKELETLNGDISSKDALKPLILFHLAGLYEQQDQLEQAVPLYQELAALEGFVPEANRALGRVYEAQGKEELALAAYRQYLSLTTEEGTLSQDDSGRQIIEERVNRLAQ